MRYKYFMVVCILLLIVLLAAGCTTALAPDDTSAEDASILTPKTTTETMPSLEAVLTQTPELTTIQTTAPDDSLVQSAPSASVSQDMTHDETDIPSDASPSAAAGAEQAYEEGSVVIRPGDTLALHIIPQLCDVFAMSAEDVKSVLAACKDSELIHDTLTDYRRMEGVVPPGTYSITTEDTLEETVSAWIDAAEARYARIAGSCVSPNDLSAWERSSLAAVVEWECLPNEYYYETAAVFLNRLARGSKLQSCVTTEYALGFTRPYLTSNDIKIQSSYNTYVVAGVPIGPICVFEDASLSAATAQSVYPSLYYFFNDYALQNMQFFSDYDSFKAAANVSRDLYNATFDVDPYEKLTDKKTTFGYSY